MDFEDAESEVSVSSVWLNSDSQQNEVLSPEDLAWVDSCLIKDFDIPESTWTPLKNALLEIISSQPQSFSSDREDTEILPSVINLELNQESSTYDVEHSSEPSSSSNVNPLSLAGESSADENPDGEETGTLPSLTFHGNPFRPTYNEDLNENETADLELNLDSFAYEVEHTSENIFKIWDLDVPSEEGELVKQLDKALSENPFQTVPSSFDDIGKLKDLKEGSLDDIIGGIADLSLNNKV